MVKKDHLVSLRSEKAMEKLLFHNIFGILFEECTNSSMAFRYYILCALAFRLAPGTSAGNYGLHRWPFAHPFHYYLLTDHRGYSVLSLSSSVILYRYIKIMHLIYRSKKQALPIVNDNKLSPYLAPVAHQSPPSIFQKKSIEILLDKHITPFTPSSQTLCCYKPQRKTLYKGSKTRKADSEYLKIAGRG